MKLAQLTSQRDVVNITQVPFLKLFYQREKSYFSILILKVASRCNLACTYCSWFRDPIVYKQAPIMKVEIFDELIKKLAVYLKQTKQRYFRVTFHGGEPLLLKKQLFSYMCKELRRVEQQTNCAIKLAITTNGVLIDQAWAQLFKRFDVGVAVSVDGSLELHNKHRPTLKGCSSYQKTADGIKTLQDNNISKLSILGVCAPEVNPQVYCEHYVEKLNVKNFDILIPHYNHDDVNKRLVQPIANFYIQLFDLWRKKYWKSAVRIHIIEAFVKAALGQRTRYPGVGICPTKVVSITPDGALEPYDVLRINGNQQVDLSLRIQDVNLDQVLEHSQWLQFLQHSLTLPSVCQNCDFRQHCRGGNVIHRYQQDVGYNNPSIYCQDYKKIYHHILSHKADMMKKGIIK